MQNINFQKGISLIESMIAIVVIIILIAVVAPTFSSIKRAQVLQNTTLDVYNAINQARSDSMSSLNGSEYGVHFETNQVIIFTGTSYVQGAPSNQIISFDSSASISGISLSPGGSDVYFNRLTGSPSAYGTITISVASSSKQVSIGITGNISTQ